MQRLIVISLLLMSKLSATYIIFNDEKVINNEKKAQLFNLVLQGEPPYTLYYEDPLDLELKCQEIAPFLRLEWIPPMLWQLSVLHAFFSDRTIQNRVLDCLGDEWSPLSFDRKIHAYLQSASSIEEVIEFFITQTKQKPNIQELFFKINSAVASLYERGNGIDTEILHLAVSEIPPLDKWKSRGFPFYNSPWIYNPNSIKLFHKALKNEPLLSHLLHLEKSANKNGKWVLYRGYDHLGYPSTLQINGDGNHALSFGSTLFGGIFFALEASAITYYEPPDLTEHSFLALPVTPHEMRKIFRWGPLHPFVQMLVDGEMFHAHTKVAKKPNNPSKGQALNGYFMKCNKYCTDQTDYILSSDNTAEDLECLFRSLCENSGEMLEPSMTTPSAL